MGKDQLIQDLLGKFGDWWNHGFATPKMTNKLYPYKNIFSPVQVNTCTIKNRLVMAPMGNISMCEETGRPNEMMIKYFEERAKGGVGLITTGLIPVTYGIDTSLIEKGKLTYFPRIDRSRTVFSGWRDLASACHAHGSKIFIQLTAGLGRVGNPQCLVNQLKFPRSASFNPNWYMKEVPCLRLSDSSINKIIKRIGQGAADAKTCNLDGIYIHGHEGYLIEQLTNPAFNRRVLGKYADYQRFGIEMVEEIRKRVGDNFPIMYRIDLSLALEETYKDRMNKVSTLKKFKGGRTIEQSLSYMKNLVKAGVDMFDVDIGCYDNWWLPHPPASMPSGCYCDIAQITKEYFKKNNILSNKGLEIPIVAVGKLGYPDLAEQALIDGKCDMVMLGRPLLADADWANKAFKGDVKDIRPCIGCQEACVNEFVEGGHPQCAVNPRTSFEFELPEEIQKAEKSKKVAVIGAGPAGIVATDVLLKRGHSVDLYEKDVKIGGNVFNGSGPKIKYEVANYLDYLKHCVEDKFTKNPKFKMLMNTEATPELLKGKYDAILFATGSNQIKPRIKGIDGKNVYTAIDVLNNSDILKDAKNIAIIGGGVVGCEVAYFLRYEKGYDKGTISVIEMSPYFMNHTCTANRGHIIHTLEEGNVQLYNYTKLLEIKEDSIVLEKNDGKNTKDAYVTWAPILPENVINPLEKKVKDKFIKQNLKVDAVILAMGAKPNNALFYEAQKTNLAKEVYLLGDSFSVAKIFEATKGAYRKALTI